MLIAIGVDKTSGNAGKDSPVFGISSRNPIVEAEDEEEGCGDLSLSDSDLPHQISVTNPDRQSSACYGARNWSGF